MFVTPELEMILEKAGIHWKAARKREVIEIQAELAGGLPAYKNLIPETFSPLTVWMVNTDLSLGENLADVRGRSLHLAVIPTTALRAQEFIDDEQGQDNLVSVDDLVRATEHALYPRNGRLILL